MLTGFRSILGPQGPFSIKICKRLRPIIHRLVPAYLFGAAVVARAADRRPYSEGWTWSVIGGPVRHRPLHAGPKVFPEPSSGRPKAPLCKGGCPRQRTGGLPVTIFRWQGESVRRTMTSAPTRRIESLFGRGGCPHPPATTARLPRFCPGRRCPHSADTSKFPLSRGLCPRSKKVARSCLRSRRTQVPIFQEGVPRSRGSRGPTPPVRGRWPVGPEGVGDAYEHRRKPGVHRRKSPGAFLVPFWASKKEHPPLLLKK